MSMIAAYPTTATHNGPTYLRLNEVAVGMTVTLCLTSGYVTLTVAAIEVGYLTYVVTATDGSQHRARFSTPVIAA